MAFVGDVATAESAAPAAASSRCESTVRQAAEAACHAWSGAPGRCMMPRCRAATIASVRSATLSRLRMMFTCHFTVASRDAKGCADLPVAEALGDQLQHLQLARAELRLRRPLRQLARDRFRNAAQAGLDRADRVRDLGVRHALQEIGLGAGIQGLVDVLVAVVGREHDEAQPGAATGESRGWPRRRSSREAADPSGRRPAAAPHTASRPPRPSPLRRATSMSGSRRMIVARPNRTTGWSSTMMTRITGETGIVVRSLGQATCGPRQASAVCASCRRAVCWPALLRS